MQSPLKLRPYSQVSHHPPVSAFHVCHPGAGVNLCAAEQPRPHFNGLSVEVLRDGLWTLSMERWGETYNLNAPSLCMRLLPVPGVEWAGVVHVVCANSGLEAKIQFQPRIIPGTQQHCVSGAIRHVSMSRQHALALLTARSTPRCHAALLPLARCCTRFAGAGRTASSQRTGAMAQNACCLLRSLLVTCRLPPA